MNGVGVAEQWSDVPFRMDDADDMIIFNSLCDAVSHGWSLSDSTTPKPENDAADQRPAHEISYSDCQNDDSKAAALLNFPHRINFNEPPPVRVTAKKRKVPASVKLSRS
ncbi:hypothetical protein JHK87_057009 [Glycine soja]|nr:hypothetical protein JHK87_057009 [Glycine soja]